MADVFISYARSTANQALAVQRALSALGYAVWRDDELPAHRAYAEVIEERLAEAKAVVVVWSAEAAKSEWVQSEADRARGAHKLVQLRVDGAPLPMPFDRIECADLTGWTGDPDQPGWRKVAASVAALLGSASQGRAARTPNSEGPLLAVLPFDNLSGDPEMAYFSDGVSEEILQSVAGASDLRVIGRSSSFQLRGADKAVARVAAQLGATHVLDGSVRRGGSRVRVTAQLIGCGDGVSLWTDRFDRDLTDVFAIQDEIAAAVAAALKKAFDKTEAPLVRPEVYDRYLRARAHRAFWADEAGQRAGLEMMEAVVQDAPSFARAWAELAYRRAACLRIFGRERFPDLTRESVVEAADRARRLDPSLGLPYVALSRLEPFGRFLQREAHLLRAREIAPFDGMVLATLTEICWATGRISEALQVASRHWELDPRSPATASACASLLFDAGREAESAAMWDEMLAKWPDAAAVGALTFAARCSDPDRFPAELARLKQAGLWTDALQEHARRLEDFRSARPEVAAARLAEAEAHLEQTGTVPIMDLTIVHYLGLPDEAFSLAERASYAYRFDDEATMRVDSITHSLFEPHARSMMHDPRFVALCGKLGLCEYWVQSGRWPDCADDPGLPYDFKAEAVKVSGGRPGR